MPGDMNLSFFGSFLYSQLIQGLPVPKTSFEGKTVIVTGSNVGLGLEAARHIAKLGVSKLILAVRSIEKGETAKASIEKSTKCSPNTIEVWPLDLSSYESVKSFAARAKQLPRLDVLLENAGVATHKWEIAEDNEKTVTVNVISTFLLAFLLLPKLKETASRYNTRPTLTIVSSDVHYMTDFAERNAPEGIFANLNDQSQSNMVDRYNVSKLMEVFIVREMAARKPADGYPVTINMLNPGLCHSELAREAGMGLYIMKLLLARSTEQGSRTLVNATTVGKETHGKFLSSCQVAEVATVARGAEGEKTQKRIWGELVEKLEKIEPGVTGNL